MEGSESRASVKNDPEIVVTELSHLGQVEADAWDQLVGPDDPFGEHTFLRGLEVTGCVGPSTGVIPRHVVVHRGGGTGRGVATL